MTGAARIWLMMLWLGLIPGLAFLSQFPPAACAAPLLSAMLVFRIWRAAVGRHIAP